MLAAQQSSGQLTAFQRSKIELLLESRLPCLGCHVVGERGGRIGPDLTAVGSRLSAARIRQQVEDPLGATPGGVMPRIALPPATVDLLVAYLAEQRGTPTANRPIVTPAIQSRSAAAQLYQKHCAACHGAGGAGDGWNAPYLDRPPARHADARSMGARTDDRLFDAIHAGAAMLGGSARMPPYGQTLTSQEIRLLVGYIRELCRCRQPAWADAAR